MAGLKADQTFVADEEHVAVREATDRDVWEAWRRMESVDRGDLEANGVLDVRDRLCGLRP